MPTHICRSKARAEGELPDDTEPRDLAGYYMTVLDGLSVRAAAGAKRDELQKVANLAMRRLAGEVGPVMPGLVPGIHV